MTEWTETYRGTVAPWECDVTEHFTIACYFDRVEQAAASIAEASASPTVCAAAVSRAGSTSASPASCGPATAFMSKAPRSRFDPALRLGHRVVDSANGDRVTWIEEVWDVPPALLTAERRDVIARRLAIWEGPAAEARPEPRTMAGAIPSARGRVEPTDLDEFGRFSLAAFVHRFTDALLQTAAAIGMTTEYMKTQRRGFSTFELALRIIEAPRLGEPYLVETGIAHLGSSSIRFLHRMSDPRSGAEFARLGQFGVQLDLDARRPAPLPDEIRARAAPLLLAFD